MNLKESIAKFIAGKILKRKDLVDVMWDRIPDLKTFFKTSLNHLFFYAKIPYSPFLTSLMIEVTNSCNLKCQHCPTTSMKRTRGLIDPALVKKIINENSKLSYIYFYNWGEPLLHKDLWEMIRLAADKNIRTSIITNGTLLDENAIEGIFESGLSTISFSMDGVDDDYKKSRGYDYGKLEEKIFQFVNEKKKKGKIIPRIELNVVIKDNTYEYIAKIESKWRDQVNAINYQPLIKYEEFNRQNPCRELWKGNLVILWDGKVVPCCVDYEGELVLGDANVDKLKDIWRKAKIKKFRSAHIRKKFMPFCRRCSEAETTDAPSRFS